MSLITENENSQAGGSSSKRRSIGRWRPVLVFAALTPFVLAVAVRWIGSTPSPVKAGPDRPALAFQQYLVDLGKVPASPVVGARFRFTNRGQHPVHITELKPSCGCLNPRLAKRDFAPGESGEIILPVQTPNEPAGLREYTLKVNYTDPQPRETLLTFRVVLPQKRVTVRPRSLIFYQLSPGTITRDFVVTDFPKLGLSLTGVECPSKYVTVKLGKQDTDAYGHPRHYVSITIADGVPPGRHRAVVTIRTDHPRYRVLKVPLMIQGPKNSTE